MFILITVPGTVAVISSMHNLPESGSSVSRAHSLFMNFAGRVNVRVVRRLSHGCYSDDLTVRHGSGLWGETAVLCSR